MYPIGTPEPNVCITIQASGSLSKRRGTDHPSGGAHIHLFFFVGSFVFAHAAARLKIESSLCAGAKEQQHIEQRVRWTHTGALARTYLVFL